MHQVPNLPVHRPGVSKGNALRTHQIRVLRVLGDAAGPLSRAIIGDRANISSTVVARALGYEDADKRAAFEANSPEGGFPSLITLEMVTRYELDIDGVIEVAYELNDAGRQAYLQTKSIHLPPPRDSYAGGQ